MNLSIDDCGVLIVKGTAEEFGQINFANHYFTLLTGYSKN